MKLYQLIAVTFLCLTLCACKHCTTASETTQTLTTLNIPNSELQRFEYTEPHMGMLFYIIFYLDDKDRADQIAEKAFERVEQLNTIMSDYIPNSELNHLTDAPKGSEIPLSDDLFEVLSISKKLYKASSGAFDPTMGPLTHLWRQCRKAGTLPSPEEIQEALSRTGCDKLVLNKKRKTAILKADKMQLDLGGIGKGFTSDKIIEFLRQQGVESAMVAASGDIAVSNPPPGKEGWTIQVETFTESEDDPDAGNYIIYLNNEAISTSGDVNQFIEIDGKRYSHIIDSKTGSFLTHRVGCTIIHKHAVYSDALATIACIKGEKEALRFLKKKYPEAKVRMAWIDGSEQKHYFTAPNFPKPLEWED
ncbi:MAG: FAD:protein FMN transferase [Verrucomicrobia bacterium]|nr:FAD:protein FMN transferase [Verrucomicrobiota bacterium]